MDTHYYSVSLASGEHLGFLVTVLDGEDQAQASGQAIIKLQPSEEAWLKRPESLSLQALGSHTPLHWHMNLTTGLPGKSKHGLLKIVS